MKFKAFYLALFGLLATSAMAAPDAESLEKASQGDPHYQNKVAFSYCKDGNINQAVKWFEKSAETGYWDSNRMLSFSYYNGRLCLRSFERNYAKAAEHFSAVYNDLKAPEGARKESAIYILDIYLWEKGGVKGNPGLIKRLVAEVTEIAHYPSHEKNSLIIGLDRATAQELLAKMYLLGKFVPEDPELAYQYAKKAENEDRTASIILALLEYQGRGTEKNVPAALDKMGKFCKPGEEFLKYCDIYDKMQQGLPIEKEDFNFEEINIRAL